MFTGIIREKGKIKEILSGKTNVILVIEAKKLLADAKPGDSVAVDGVCLTVTQRRGKQFNVDVMPETLKKTIIEKYRVGQKVNLEKPLKVGDTLDGHFVQGHVDGKGTIKSLIRDKKDGVILTVKFPQELGKYIAMKGSITINGVSLTVMGVTQDTVMVALIPTTLELTNLGGLKKGDEVNLEVDVLARYLEKLK